MKTDDLDYSLPLELIAQHPSPIRSRSRLLVMDRKKDTFSDKIFSDIVEYINPGDCLVLNNTKVLPARFFARRETGATLEGLFIDSPTPGEWQVMLKNARRVKPGEAITLLDKEKREFCSAAALKKLDQGKWLIELRSAEPSQQILEKIGFAPLPPYIKRPEDRAGESDDDIRRYQTVYAKRHGAVAAPTAGLHFTDELIEQLKQKGVQLSYVTLHVGLGTFRPVSAEDLNDHKMHAESYQLTEENAGVINECKKNGSRVIAVGTTSVRTLETIGKNGTVATEKGSTDLFIQPGFEFDIVDAMITNFHLPKSTLIALVGAFTGMEKIMAAYKYAMENKYRFYSYGDAMLII